MIFMKKHFSLDYLPFITRNTCSNKTNKLVQLDKNSKVPIAGVKDRYQKYNNLDGSSYAMKSDDWIPFEDSTTGIITNYYDDYQMYLCVLDFDYPEKYDAEVYKTFKYKSTYTRESRNGLHLFFWSDKPRKYIEKKDKLKIDFKMCSAEGVRKNPESLGGYVRYYPEYQSNGLPVMKIDINTVIASLYKSNGVELVEQGTYSTNRKKTSDDYVFNDYTEALALYFYYKISAENPLWEDGYHIAWRYGLKLGGYIKSPEEARGFAIRLMELATVYDKPPQFIKNFLKGWSASDDRKNNNFGGDKLTKLAIKYYIKQNLSLAEYAKQLFVYDFHSYLSVINHKIKEVRQ